MKGATAAAIAIRLVDGSSRADYSNGDVNNRNRSSDNDYNSSRDMQRLHPGTQPLQSLQPSSS